MENKHMYIGNIKPELDTIFVFGSNPEGRHGAGSAYIALRYFGAIYRRGEGLYGNSYALPTTELRYDYQDKDADGVSRHSMNEEHIIEHIKRMYKTAKEHPDKKFKVAYRNQPDEVTLCGYSGKELSSLFNEAGPIPNNVYFSQEWIENGLINLNNFEKPEE